MSKIYIILLFFCFGCLHDPKPVNFSEIVESFNKNKNDFSTNPNRLSEKFFSSELNNVKKELKRLRTVNIDDLNDEQKIDHRFIETSWWVKKSPMKIFNHGSEILEII